MRQPANEIALYSDAALNNDHVSPDLAAATPLWPATPVLTGTPSDRYRWVLHRPWIAAGNEALAYTQAVGQPVRADRQEPTRPGRARAAAVGQEEVGRVEEVTDEPPCRDRACGIDIGRAGLVATIRVTSGRLTTDLSPAGHEPAPPALPRARLRFHFRVSPLEARRASR